MDTMDVEKSRLSINKKLSNGIHPQLSSQRKTYSIATKILIATLQDS
jgi:hypothetical protein